MWRTCAVAAVVAFVLAVAAVVASEENPARASKGDANRPNIVVVMTDDQTIESLRVMPKVERLLTERGVSFPNSFASNPVCCPSRATFLTGQYSHTHGVFRSAPPNGGVEALDASETLPVALQRSGYFTAHVGKYLNGYGLRTDPQGVPPGWNDWRASVDPTTYRMFGYVLNQNGTLVTFGRYDDEDPAKYQTDVYAQKAVSLIERRAPRRKPFFLSIAPLAPHNEMPPKGEPQPVPNPRPAPRHADAFDREPLPASPSFNEEDVSDKPAAVAELPPISDQIRELLRGRYQARLASLLAVDDLVGRVTATLRREGELDETLIVFTSDNGFLLGQHRIRVGKERPYEESIGVPLILRGPGIPRGEVRRALVANIDLAPTILDYANARPAAPTDGRSLQQIVGDRRFNPGRAIVLENWCNASEECFDPEVPRYRGVRTDRYAYVEYPTGERELYDLKRDPGQLESLHADPAYERERNALAQLLAELQDCAGRECRADPRLKLDLAYEVNRVSGRRCTASAVEATIGGADAGEAVSARFRGPGRASEDERRPLRTRIPRRALDANARTRVAAEVTVLDGRVETVTKSIPRVCAT